MPIHIPTRDFRRSAEQDSPLAHDAALARAAAASVPMMETWRLLSAAAAAAQVDQRHVEGADKLIAQLSAQSFVCSEEGGGATTSSGGTEDGAPPVSAGADIPAMSSMEGELTAIEGSSGGISLTS